jgi:hypothetical protein
MIDDLAPELVHCVAGDLAAQRLPSLKLVKINALAEKLVECAIEDKQGWAFQQIIDRLEGKAVQPVAHSTDDYTDIRQFSDAELTAIMRGFKKGITDALRLEVNRTDPKNPDRRKINALAEKLVECAIEDKQGWAFQQIIDRLEGKAVQPVARSIEDYTDIRQFSDAELTAIMRGRLKVVSVESDEERPEDERLN